MCGRAGHHPSPRVSERVGCCPCSLHLGLCTQGWDGVGWPALKSPHLLFLSLTKPWLGEDRADSADNLGSLSPVSQVALPTGCRSTMSAHSALNPAPFPLVFGSTRLRFYLLGIPCEQGPVPTLRSTQLINSRRGAGEGGNCQLREQEIV